jgi:nucleoid DNA-binding protein
MSALASGENVEINSFGKFVHVNGQRHVGRNFKTGETILKTAETIEISARRNITLRRAKELRQVRSFSK